MNSPSSLVLRLLASLGHDNEAQTYLSWFRSGKPETFALIVVDSELSTAECEAFATDLQFMADLHLFPCVAFFEKDHIAKLAEECGNRVRCQTVAPDEARLVQTLSAIPFVVLPNLHQVAQLAAGFAVRKLIFLDRENGVLTTSGKQLSIINTNEPVNDLDISADDRAWLEELQLEFANTSNSLTISVTSPFDLLRELFTVRGAGTLLRRSCRVVRKSPTDDIAWDKVQTLLEGAFSKPLREGALTTSFSHMYVADDYRGIAITKNSPAGVYLSKFAVDLRARGDGVGGDIWRALLADVTDELGLFWRAKPENPITPWYQQQCDGMQRADVWQIFWCGLLPDKLQRAIDFALQAPVDFREPAGE